METKKNASFTLEDSRAIPAGGNKMKFFRLKMNRLNLQLFGEGDAAESPSMTEDAAGPNVSFAAKQDQQNNPKTGRSS